VSTLPPAAVAARLLPLLDLTSLGEDDTPAAIRALCASARLPAGLPAALCVHPEYVLAVREAMAGTGVKVATVVNFPDGGDDATRIARETRRAIAAGADEIDLVLPYRALMAGRTDAARRGIDACREVCGPRTVLKLILETGELASPARIRTACRIGLTAGVDFLKTSTGKVAVNATIDAAAIMLDEIASGGGLCGFKAAGGLRTLAAAQAYVALAEERLGAGWVTPVRFRIGASGLFADIAAALAAPAA
jgi:deoxyribose-phosphate aldolase